jgi:DNA repair exonuclease SbcCD ATPase subunit
MSIENEQILALAGEPVATTYTQKSDWISQGDGTWIAGSIKAAIPLDEDVALYTADQVLAATKSLEEQHTRDVSTLECWNKAITELQAERDELRQQLAEEKSDYLEVEQMLHAEQDISQSIRMELTDMRQQLAEKDSEIGKLRIMLISADKQAFDHWEKATAAQAREQQYREKAAKYDYLLSITEHGCYQLHYWDTDRDSWSSVAVADATSAAPVLTE